MHVYSNFYCSPAKFYGSDPPLFWAGDATGYCTWFFRCKFKNLILSSKPTEVKWLNFAPQNSCTGLIDFGLPAAED